MSNIKNSQSNPLKCSAPVRPPGGDTAPKKVYVCSPFRPMAASVADKAEEQRSNIERALKACRILAMMGIQPLAPHLYFTRFLKDDVAAERDTGIRFALSWLEQADELWVFGERVSDGMAQEIAKAKELGKPVHTLPEPGRVAELLMLNLHATFTKGTIEFRLFQFADPSDGKQNGLHAGELKAYIQLCLAMSQLAKMVKTASPKPQQTDNEKYAMRCWMLRLGFIGDEFKTAREILLRNMEGNASWRNA